MIGYPPAKINLGLNVVSKRPDGFHNIESVFYPIPLVDILEINKSEEFSFSMSGLAVQGDSNDNLIVRAFNLLKKHHHISNVRIHLHKQIPMGAGLGGGSADASKTLTMLNEIFELDLSIETLENYASELGSDCPFFIEEKPKYVTETGNKMASVAIDLTGYYLWIVNPSIHIGTKETYGGISPKASNHNLEEEVKNDISAWKSTIKNDFESSVFKKHPLLSDIKLKMYSLGALYVSMSGTGSTIYGLCKEKPSMLGGFDFEKLILL